MVTTILEYVGAVVIAAGLAGLVVVFAAWLWPVALVVFGVGLIGVSALFSKVGSK